MFADPTDRADGTPAVGGRRPSRRARHAAADTEPGPWAPPVAAPHRPGDAAVVPAEAEVAVSPAAADPAAADQVDAVAGPAGGDTTAAGQPCTGDVSPPTRPYAGDFREARAARRYRGDAAGRADWPARDRVARDPAGAWAPDDTAGWPVSGRPAAWDTRARPSDRLPAAPPAGRSAADPAVRQPRPTQERTWAAPARDHQPGRGGGRVEADPLLDWLPPEAAASRPAHGGAPTGPEPPVTPEPPTAPPPACPSPAPPPAACDRLVADHAPGGGNADSHAATPHTTDPHTTNSHTTDPHTAGTGTVDLDVVGPGTVGGDTSGAGAAAAAGERPVPDRTRGRGTRRRSRSQRGGRNLPAAIGVGVLLGAVVLGSLTDPLLFAVVVAAAAAVGVLELVRAVRTAGVAPPLPPLLLGAGVIPVLGFASGAEGLALGLLVTVLAAGVWRLGEGPRGYGPDLAAAAMVTLYVPFLLGFAAPLARVDRGMQWVLMTLAVVVLSDTGGYAVGVRWGKHAMAPHVSPKKSWEGLGGSLVTAGLGGVLLGWLLLDLAPWRGAVFGLVVAATAVVGDLAESMIKRDLGVKDMSNLLPGHGGLMDRLDSIIFAVPTAYLLVVLLGAGGN